jgi:hypothetical protein
LQPEEIQRILSHLDTPFYKSTEFWINLLIGCGGVFFSILAFIEAKKAKLAANEAGRTVKIQTVTIELGEIAQRLDKLDSKLTFSEARDSLNEISRRLRRLIAPFQEGSDLKEPCAKLRETLDAARVSLDSLLPQDGLIENLPPNSVYFATQSHLTIISGLVAEIMGLFEKSTIKVDR